MMILNSDQDKAKRSRGGRPRLLIHSCLGVSMTVKRHHDRDCSYKGKHSIVMAHLQFRGSVHYHHGREYDRVQADMVLAK